ncbi:hypothetical protein FISHEDRAFT_63361 [Fistulina hepatica ATCC 64428]|uniref:Uncharacterized protein n=1 Tax=Fistulina hepatica ATCC 64428 TaxID=1128425 RepID=A0A0D7AQ65_9AGAR|nr:hypothetical protein FISHEDRAFT_63361 [Fistulina hepatica ATCC 64428]
MSYPVPPPSYGTNDPQGKNTQNHFQETAAAAAASSSGLGGAYFDQPEANDVPDDFKYGTCVADSALEIRLAFVRKVYSILLQSLEFNFPSKFFLQLATCIVGGAISSSSSALFWVTTHTWSFYVPLFGTLFILGFLYWKRHSYPINFVLLSVFTLMEAFTLGVTVAFFDKTIVMQALLITLGVFIGLTLFTLQSKYDFSGMGPFLFGGLIALLMTGLVGMFIPFSRTMDLIYAIGGCLLFSGYVVYDTYIINSRLSPDEFIAAAVSLYLDFINLFKSCSNDTL